MLIEYVLVSESLTSSSLHGLKHPVLGLHLADASVFISCAMALAVFDITKMVENGQVIVPEVEYTSGTIR